MFTVTLWLKELRLSSLRIRKKKPFYILIKMPSTEDTTKIVTSFNKDIILILVQIEDGQKKPSTLDFQKRFTLHGLIKLRVPDLVNDLLNDSV